MNYLPQANLLTIESQNASTVPHTVTLPDYMTLEYSTSTACERPLARVCPDNGQYTVQDGLTMQQQRAWAAQRSLANVRAPVPSCIFEAGGHHDRVARGEPDGN